MLLGAPLDGILDLRPVSRGLLGSVIPCDYASSRGDPAPISADAFDIVFCDVVFLILQLFV